MTVIFSLYHHVYITNIYASFHQKPTKIKEVFADSHMHRFSPPRLGALSVAELRQLKVLCLFSV